MKLKYKSVQTSVEDFPWGKINVHIINCYCETELGEIRVFLEDLVDQSVWTNLWSFVWDSMNEDENEAHI